MDLHYGAGVCVVTELASVLPCSFGQSFIYFFKRVGVFLLSLVLCECMQEMGQGKDPSLASRSFQVR